MENKTIDFLITFTKTDAAWAGWIAAQLKAEGYEIRLQADPGPRTPEAAARARHSVVLLSPEALRAPSVLAELAKAIAWDSGSGQRSFIPRLKRSYTSGK